MNHYETTRATGRQLCRAHARVVTVSALPWLLDALGVAPDGAA